MSINAILGGVCIGIGAMLLMVLNGRIAGISGIVYQSFDEPRGRNWALFFWWGFAWAWLSITGYRVTRVPYLTSR